MIWFALLACFVISFTFSGIEAGVLSVNRVRLRHNARRGELAAIQLDALLARIERLMITVVLVNNAANIVAVALLVGFFTGLVGPWGGLIALLVALPVFVLLLEFLPRVIFRRFPYRTLVGFARILTTAHMIFSPIIAIGAAILRPLLRPRGIHRDRRLVRLEDMRRIISESVGHGQISPTARDFIHHVVDFRDVRASDLMIPFREVGSVRPDTPVAEILKRAKESDTDRFPVINSDGQCAGVVRVFDLVRDGVTTGRAQSYARRAVSFRLDTPGMDVLKKLRAARSPVGLVADSHGVPVGLVTTEALIRRMLGGKK